jgi:hypothetical protein
MDERKAILRKGGKWGISLGGICSYCGFNRPTEYSAEYPRLNRFGEPIMMQLELCAHHAERFAKKHGLPWPVKEENHA